MAVHNSDGTGKAAYGIWDAFFYLLVGTIGLNGGAVIAKACWHQHLLSRSQVVTYECDPLNWHR